MRSVLSFGFLSVGIVALSVAAACSNDKGSSSGNDGGTNNGTGGGGGGDVKVVLLPDGGLYCPPDKPIANGENCATMEDAVSQCKETSAKTIPGTKVDDETCGAGCTCVKCTQAMVDCGNDPDQYCAKVITCANAKNCTGTDCYAAATCMDVIDAAPNGGLQSPSVGLAGAVGNCIKPQMGPQVCLPTCN
jgi:hypothetical protein